MKKRISFGIFDSAVAGISNFLLPLTSASGNVDNSDSGLFKQARTELLELKLALVTSQKNVTAKQQQIDMHVKINLNLNQKFTKFEKSYTQAVQLAFHDELTGLPNRTLLLDRLKQVIAQSDRQNKQVALLFIDLDKFKTVNDNLGHAAGDKLLQQVAERINTCIRYGDTASRYGGDEFVVLLPNIKGLGSATIVKEKIRKHLSQSYSINNHVIDIKASIGTAIYAGNGQNSADFIKQADDAMYRVKALGEQ